MKLGVAVSRAATACSDGNEAAGRKEGAAEHSGACKRGESTCQGKRAWMQLRLQLPGSWAGEPDSVWPASWPGPPAINQQIAQSHL